LFNHPSYLFGIGFTLGFLHDLADQKGNRLGHAGADLGHDIRVGPADFRDEFPQNPGIIYRPEIVGSDDGLRIGTALKHHLQDFSAYLIGYHPFGQQIDKLCEIPGFYRALGHRGAGLIEKLKEVFGDPAAQDLAIPA
jgi:hypothetical protein